MEQPENLPKPACAWRTPVLMLCPGMAAIRHPACRWGSPTDSGRVSPVRTRLIRAAVRSPKRAAPSVLRCYGRGFPPASVPVQKLQCSAGSPGRSFTKNPKCRWGSPTDSDRVSLVCARFIRVAVRSPKRLSGSSARLPVRPIGCPFAQTAARLSKRAALSALRCYGRGFPPASVPAQNPCPLRSCSAPPGRRAARSQRTRSADGAPRRIRTGPCCRQARSHRPR